MVTMANNKTLEALKLELADARNNLKRLEDEQANIENKIFCTKEAITDTLIKMESESLPTGLYNKGYKLREKEHKFILVDYFGEEIFAFNHVPSLGDLMDAEHQLLSS